MAPLSHPAPCSGLAALRAPLPLQLSSFLSPWDPAPSGVTTPLGAAAIPSPPARPDPLTPESGPPGPQPAARTPAPRPRPRSLPAPPACRRGTCSCSSSRGHHLPAPFCRGARSGPSSVRPSVSPRRRPVQGRGRRSRARGAGGVEWGTGPRAARGSPTCS